SETAQHFDTPQVSAHCASPSEFRNELQFDEAQEISGTQKPAQGEAEVVESLYCPAQVDIHRPESTMQENEDPLYICGMPVPMQRQHNSLHEKYHYDEEISAPLNGFMQRLKSVNHPHDNSLQHSTTLDTLRTRQTNAPTPFFDEPHTAISSTRTTPA